MHTTPRTCLHWQIYQREFKLRWCYPSLAASSKDCREEQTEGWIWQGYFRVQRWDCCLEMPRHLRGAQPSSQTTSGWRPPPCQAREAEERGKRPAKGTSLGASSPGAWCTCPCRGPAAPALGRWTHCPMARSALRVHGPPPPRSLLRLPNPSVLTALYIRVTPQRHLFFSSPALFYPVHHFFPSIYLLLCRAVHLRESA